MRRVGPDSAGSRQEGPGAGGLGVEGREGSGGIGWAESCRRQARQLERARDWSVKRDSSAR